MTEIISETKKCKKCNQVKDINCFYKHKTNLDGLSGHCRECNKIRRRKNYLENKDKQLAQSKKWDKNNKQKLKENKRKWAIKNKEKMKLYRKEYGKKWREKNKEKIKKRMKIWRKNNRDRINKNNTEWIKRRCIEDPVFKFKNSLIRRFRKEMNKVVGKSWVKSYTNDSLKMLGCTLDFFKKYIANKFTDGMNWENYGKWEIDHIIPISSFDLTNQEDVKRCFHYTNTRPLYKKENVSKHNNMPPDDIVESINNEYDRINLIGDIIGNTITSLEK